MLADLVLFCREHLTSYYACMMANQKVCLGFLGALWNCALVD